MTTFAPETPMLLSASYATPPVNDAVADNRDHTARVPVKPPCRGEAVRIRKRRGSVAVLDEIVLGLGAVRVAGHAAALAQADETVLPAGDELVHIGLVTGVPDEGVVGRREDAVQGDGELHNSEVRAQMTPGRRDARDEELADLRHEQTELAGPHLAETLG